MFFKKLDKLLIFCIGSNCYKSQKLKKSIKLLPLRDLIFHIPIDVFWCADSKYHKINRCFSINKRALGQKLRNAKNQFFNFQSKVGFFTYCSTRLELLIPNLYRFAMICKEISELWPKNRLIYSIFPGLAGNFLYLM